MRRPAADRTAALRRGDALEVTVEKGVYRGLGLARHEGRVVFVPRGLPGDSLRVQVETTTPGYVRAAIAELRQPGPGRRATPCPYFSRCGGCAYQELGYAAQLRLKEQILRESLARAGAPWAGAIPVHGSREEAWRMRCSFHLEEGAEGAFRLGLREEASHSVVDLPRCLQVSDAVNGALRALLGALAQRPLLARRVHGVEVAESLDAGRLVACLDTELTAAEASALSVLADAAPWITGLGVVVGQRARRRFLPLRGDPHVEATVLGVHFRSHVRSFFQANRFLLEPLVSEVVSRVPPGGTVLDLYAGVGLFALALGARAERVLGIEVNPMAVEDAAANAQRAGLTGVRIHQGDVLEGLASWRATADERVVLDPPRTGTTPLVVKAIVARRPASITYVSCDPPTLGRDLKLLAAHGYGIDAVSAFDLFPDTFHVEAVVHLLRG